MFGFRPEYLVAMLILALLFFGPKRLPEMGSAIGKSIQEFRKGMNALESPKETPPVSPPLLSSTSVPPTPVAETTAMPDNKEVIQ